jgi:hypothetical protein
VLHEHVVLDEGAGIAQHLDPLARRQLALEQTIRRSEQGCQMANFQTKNHLGKFCSVLQ